jgi:hypothetical protein
VLHNSASILSTHNLGVPCETDCYLVLSSRFMRTGAYIIRKKKIEY